MKRAKTLIYTVAAFLAALMLQSCSDTTLTESITLSTSKLESTLGQKTEVVIDAMIKSYKDIDNLTFENDYDNAISSMLANTDSELAPISIENDSMNIKLQLLFLYKQAIHEYALLADAGFTGQQNAFSKCCSNIQTNYSELGDTLAIKTAKTINSHLKSNRYDENQVTSILLKALLGVWENDVKSWNTSLSQSFIDYQNNLSMIPESSFSEEKLAKYVYQPYEGKHNLVEAYKLNLLKERRAKITQFIDNENNITSALHCISGAVDEMKKDKCDKNIVVNYLNRIDLILGTNNKDAETSKE